MKDNKDPINISNNNSNKPILLSNNYVARPLLRYPIGTYK